MYDSYRSSIKWSDFCLLSKSILPFLMIHSCCLFMNNKDHNKIRAILMHLMKSSKTVFCLLFEMTRLCIYFGMFVDFEATTIIRGRLVKNKRKIKSRHGIDTSISIIIGSADIYSIHLWTQYVEILINIHRNRREVPLKIDYYPFKQHVFYFSKSDDYLIITNFKKF